MNPSEGQDLAYERAVMKARGDPSMRRVVEESFLQEDARIALAAFAASEHAARVRRRLHLAGVGRGARLLDVGGGRGLMSALLTREGFEVVLCEPNPSAICGAGAAQDLQAMTGISFEVAEGGIESLSRGPRFDVAVCRAVLHHIEPLVPVLRDVWGRLVPGGSFLAVDEPTVRLAKHEPRALAVHPFVPYGVRERAFTPRYYRRALKRAGFVGVHARFPVAYSDYRSLLRSEGPAFLAFMRYSGYRLRDQLLHPPGTVRTLLARRPKS